MITAIPFLQRGDAILDSFSETDAIEILQRRSQQANGARAPVVNYQWGTSLVLMVANALSFDDDEEYLLWSIRGRDSGAVIGAISFALRSTKSAVIDFSLFSERVSGTTVVDAIRCAMEWAFGEHASLESIECDREARDLESIRIMNDVGMRYVESFFAMNTARHQPPVLLDKWDMARAAAPAVRIATRTSRRNGTR